MATTPDGYLDFDGVQVPFIMASVCCHNDGCPQQGVVHVVQLFPTHNIPVCWPCLKLNGQDAAQHVMSDADAKRLAGLPVPLQWQAQAALGGNPWVPNQ